MTPYTTGTTHTHTHRHSHKTEQIIPHKGTLKRSTPNLVRNLCRAEHPGFFAVTPPNPGKSRVQRTFFAKRGFKPEQGSICLVPSHMGGKWAAQKHVCLLPACLFLQCSGSRRIMLTSTRQHFRVVHDVLVLNAHKYREIEDKMFQLWCMGGKFYI